jgi:hypothetical protein
VFSNSTFLFSSSAPQHHEQIYEAIQIIENVTCVRFVNYTDEVDYVNITGKFFRSCKSKVGRRGGEQTVKLPWGKCNKTGHILHEFVHTLGFHHIVNSPNRDDYIEIVWENVDPTYKNRFYKMYDYGQLSDFGTGYDYDSILHTPHKGYSITGSSTIKTLDPNNQHRIGQRKRLSDGDILRINRMYKCDEKLKELEQVVKSLDESLIDLDQNLQDLEEKLKTTVDNLMDLNENSRTLEEEREHSVDNAIDSADHNKDLIETSTIFYINEAKQDGNDFSSNRNSSDSGENSTMLNEISETTGKIAENLAKNATSPYEYIESTTEILQITNETIKNFEENLVDFDERSLNLKENMKNSSENLVDLDDRPQKLEETAKASAENTIDVDEKTKKLEEKSKISQEIVDDSSYLDRVSNNSVSSSPVSNDIL